LEVPGGIVPFSGCRFTDPLRRFTMKSSQTMLSGLGLVVALLATSQQARADDCYGSFVVRNPSNVAIHYQVKWGDGDWKSYCVQSGWSKYHYYPLDENGCVPTPRIRFDYIAGDNDVTYKTYKLDVYATHCPDRGKKHVFRYSRCGCFLDLYAE
jgi:hypothetical protein